MSGEKRERWATRLFRLPTLLYVTATELRGANANSRRNSSHSFTEQSQHNHRCLISRGLGRAGKSTGKVAVVTGASRNAKRRH
jgi:hypothetical protein